MIVIRVKVRVKPEAKADFLASVKPNIEESLRFPGCTRFEVLEDVLDDHQFMLYEEWDSLKNFDGYRNSDYFKASAAPMFGMLDGEPDAAYFSAETVA
jgi:(4S)-4-hydroxy-5-phosphonooxypentane-2,3-dione isomerase